MFDPTIEAYEERIKLDELSPRQVPADRVNRKFDSETIEQKFLRYHREHPSVYTTLVEYARRAISRGYKTLGIGFLVEIVRWSEDIPGVRERFKINNDYCSRYARLIMAQEPDLAGFFKTRQLITK
jgi:hypothetical protein